MTIGGFLAAERGERGLTLHEESLLLSPSPSSHTSP
jgi:hypothetical protein